MGATGDAAVRHAVDVAENCLGAVDGTHADANLGFELASTSEKLGWGERAGRKGAHVAISVEVQRRKSPRQRAKESEGSLVLYAHAHREWI